MTFKKTIHAVDTHGGTPMRVGTGGRRSPGRWIARAGQPYPRRVHRGASMASPRARRTIWPGAARLRHSAVRLPPMLSSSEGWGAGAISTADAIRALAKGGRSAGSSAGSTTPGGIVPRLASAAARGGIDT